MRLTIKTGEAQIVEIDDASPEEAAAFVAALGKEAGRSGTLPASEPPAAVPSSSSLSLRSEPEWFLALDGATRIVVEVLARVWAATSTGEGVEVENIRLACKWSTVNPRCDGDQTVAWLKRIMEKIDSVSKAHKGPPRRQILMKRESNLGLWSLKLYAGKDLVTFVRKIAKDHTVSEVMDVLTSS